MSARWLLLVVVACAIGCEGEPEPAAKAERGKGRASAPARDPEVVAKEVGYKSLAERTEFKVWLAGEGRTPREIHSLTQKEEERLHEFLKRPNAPGPRTHALMAVSRLNGADLQKKFVDDIRPLFAQYPKDSTLKRVLVMWCSRGGYDHVVSLRKDKDPAFAAAAKLQVAIFDNPRPNASGAGG